MRIPDHDAYPADRRRALHITRERGWRLRMDALDSTATPSRSTPTDPRRLGGDPQRRRSRTKEIADPARHDDCSDSSTPSTRSRGASIHAPPSFSFARHRTAFAACRTPATSVGPLAFMLVGALTLAGCAAPARRRSSSSRSPRPIFAGRSFGRCTTARRSDGLVRRVSPPGLSGSAAEQRASSAVARGFEAQSAQSWRLPRWRVPRT
jgi:hypothetical protein